MVMPVRSAFTSSGAHWNCTVVSLMADLGIMSRRPTFSADGARLLAGSQVKEIATRATVPLAVEASLSVYLTSGRIAVADRKGVVRLVCPVK